MYLNKYNLSSNITNRKQFSFFSSYPFSRLSVTKAKSKILYKVLGFQDIEENYLSLIDFNLLMKLKMKKKKLKTDKENNLEESFTSLRNKKEDDTVNLRKTKSYFPLIKRNKRKIKTFHFFKEMEKKVIFNDLLLENPNNESAKNKKENFRKFFSCKNNKKKVTSKNITKNTNDNQLNNLINNKDENCKITNNSKENYKLLRTVSLNDIDNNSNLLNPTYYFSFEKISSDKNKNPINLKNPLKKSKSTFNSTNIKFLKNTTTYSDFLTSSNNYYNINRPSLKLKNDSQKTLTNYDTLSILKKPEIRKDSFNSFHYFNKSNIFLTSKIDNINSNKNNRNNSSFISHSKNSSFEEDNKTKSKINENAKNENKDNIENYVIKNKKFLKLKIINRINELEKELKKLKNENGKKSKENRIFIHNMIKKCKHILKIIDDKIIYDIINIVKEFDKTEVINYLNKNNNVLRAKTKNINSKNKNKNNLRYKNIIKNRHIIYDLIDKNNQIEKRANNFIDKLLEKK